MTPLLRNAFMLFGFLMCLCDVQMQNAQDNLFAGNFLPDQELWLTLFRYGLCCGAVIFSTMALISTRNKNLGFSRNGFIFLFLLAFGVAASIRSAFDVRSGLYLLSTGSRHILTFAIVAMAASVSRNSNCVRPMLMGALPPYIFRFIYSTYNFVMGEGIEITGGIRSVALDAGFMVFGIFYLFIAIQRTASNFEAGKSRAAFGWMLTALVLLFLPIASFRRATIVVTVASVIFGFMIHAYAKRVFLRQLLPILSVNVMVAVVSGVMFFAAFGGDVAMERLRSFALHDEGDLSASNAEYERDFDYTWDLIKRNPILGIGFSNPYGVAGRDDETDTASRFVDSRSEMVLHVGLFELVVRQGIAGILVWITVFIWIPIRRIEELRRTGTDVSLVGCLCIAFFILYANMPTSPPFYNEVRPAIFLGLALGVATAKNPQSLFDKPVTSFIPFRTMRSWLRVQEA